MKKQVKIYKIESLFSSREIQAHNKKQAIEFFLLQVPSAKSEKLKFIK
jgi:hypothetical protein